MGSITNYKNKTLKTYLNLNPRQYKNGKYDCKLEVIGLPKSRLVMILTKLSYYRVMPKKPVEGETGGRLKVV